MILTNIENNSNSEWLLNDANITILYQQQHKSTSTMDDCWPDDATSIIFQLAYICLLIAYLAPNGRYCLLFIHFMLSIAHLLMAIWVSNICYIIPSLFGWSLIFITVNLLRFVIQLYMAKRAKFAKELEPIYEELFAIAGVSRDSFKKLVLQAKLLTLHSGEAYAIEKVTPTNRLALLISGKVNVISRNNYLHSINSGEFLDSPEWESGFICLNIQQYQKKDKNAENFIPKTNQKQISKKFYPKNDVESRTIDSDELIRNYPLNIDHRSATMNNKNSQSNNVNDCFNVSLIAATQCRIICWDRLPLEHYLTKDKKIFKIFDLIIGRDITNKLYTMNEKIISSKGSILDIRLPILITSMARHLDLLPSADADGPLVYNRKYTTNNNSNEEDGDEVNESMKPLNQ